jgi:hypothetical protein
MRLHLFLDLNPPGFGNRLKALGLTVVLFTLLSPALSAFLFLDLPEATDAFDCDDAVLFMYERLERFNIDAIPFVGSLNETGEQYGDSNHIWLQVRFAGLVVAFDWGSLWLDRQHYEGYPVNYAQLLEFIQQDKQSIQFPASRP